LAPASAIAPVTHPACDRSGRRADTHNPLKCFGFAGVFTVAADFLLAIGPMVHYLRSFMAPLSATSRLLATLVLVVTSLNGIAAIMEETPAQSASPPSGHIVGQ
jgi:hypothetical protein